VTLESAGEFEVSLGTEGVDELAALGFQEGSYGGASDGTFLKDIDISTYQGAQDAITAIDNALKTVSSQRAELGALQNRFESTSSNLQITSENLAAANSRIRDADFAAETAELSRTQVLQQAGISILAQANQLPQQVLSLLG
jgi:flagellin